MRQLAVLGSNGDGRGMALCRFLGKRRTTERSDAYREWNRRSDDFRHAQQGIVLDALGRADKQHRLAEVRAHRLEQMPGVMRRHDADHDRGLVQRFGEIVGGTNRGGNRVAGKKQLVDVAGVDAVTNFRLMRPQSDVVGPLASQHDGNGRAPGSGSDDGNFAHGLTIDDFRCRPSGVGCWRGGGR